MIGILEYVLHRYRELFLQASKTLTQAVQARSRAIQRKSKHKMERDPVSEPLPPGGLHVSCPCNVLQEVRSPWLLPDHAEMRFHQHRKKLRSHCIYRS